ncbi:MAG: hypothetical protein IJ452_01495 [Butyricicoccus sp.]|nr:hypothetical protein [Butyricicoccus sp.]
MKCFIKQIICLFLVLISTANLFSVSAARNEEPEKPDPYAGFAGKTISILGESISTFENRSNGMAAYQTNSTIGRNWIFYEENEYPDVSAEDTWWQQVADQMGMRVLVNNSWSGSHLLKEECGTPGAYVDRCVQLHDDTGANKGETPDIIAIFMGTNDQTNAPSTMGTESDIEYDELISETEEGFVYAEPATAMEAYAIILHKIGQRYPEAEVYCCTMLPHIKEGVEPAAGNREIIAVAERFGAIVVDTYHCGITADDRCVDQMMIDAYHPDGAGMDAITNAFVSAMLKHSRFRSPDQTVHEIIYDVSDTFVLSGKPSAVIDGEPLTVTFPEIPGREIDVTVAMGGKDITEAVAADSTIFIEAVTADVFITASGRKPADNYRWEMGSEGLNAVSGDGYSINAAERHEIYLYQYPDFPGVCYILEEPVVLYPDRTWSVEWQAEGNWYHEENGSLMLVYDVYNGDAFDYLYCSGWNGGFIALGEREYNTYNNHGICFPKDAGTHIYRLTNRVAADGTNAVWLYVDEQEIGCLDQWHQINTPAGTLNWANGRTIEYRFIGSANFPIDERGLSYLQIQEGEEVRTHSVSFTDRNGKTISIQNVIAKKGAEAPFVPQIEHSGTSHHIFRGWDKDFSCVTSDLTVAALYESESDCVTNGFCSVCRQDYADVIREDAAVTVVLPGVSADASVYVAFYRENGRVLGLQQYDAAEDRMVFDLKDSQKVSEIKVFVLDRNGVPLRLPVS